MCLVLMFCFVLYSSFSSILQQKYLRGVERGDHESEGGDREHEIGPETAEQYGPSC